mmetsp:Transcript_51618/g.85607  ORF Transcript_51618/g.85607 Transcript_51618/m.85607 type:complete len:438 (+) Transcript_51618:3-1316(+)
MLFLATCTAVSLHKSILQQSARRHISHPSACDVEGIAPSRCIPMNRRRIIGLGSVALQLGLQLQGLPAIATARLEGYEPSAAVTTKNAGRLFFPPLTPPLLSRATYRYELGRNSWALEQLLTFANVSATIRTVVVRMKDGGLWVNSPQWPTGEFTSLLDELGQVRHVVLPCNALEHAAPVKAFARRYPTASVWVTPGQYGPFGTCGFTAASAKLGYRVDGVLPIGKPSLGDALPPWADEFDMRTLYVSLPENAGPVSEAAFYHKPSATLIATDAVVFVPPEAPPIFGTYFSEQQLAPPDFWAKTVLQSVFLPLRRADVPASSSPDETWPAFAAVRGRLVRAPILRAFADSRAPAAVSEWVEDVAAMGPFDRILTAHFASPIAATSSDLQAAFAFLRGPVNEPPIECRDWALLDSLNGFIEQNQLGAPLVYDFKAGCK